MRLALLPYKTKDGNTNNYGCGFSLSFGDGKLRTWGHNGGNGGVWTSYYHDALEDHSIAVLCNRNDLDSGSIWSSIDPVVRAKYFKK